MNSFVIYLNEVTDSLDILYFLSSSNAEISFNKDIIINKEIISNYNIIEYINFSDLTTIFLLGLFSSLCFFTYCFYSKKTVPKYFVIQQEPIYEKIVNV